MSDTDFAFQRLECRDQFVFAWIILPMPAFRHPELGGDNAAQQLGGHVTSVIYMALAIVLLHKQITEFGSAQKPQVRKRLKRTVHPLGKMAVREDSSREKIEMRVIHTTNAFGALGSRSVLKDQGTDSPLSSERLANGADQALQSRKMLGRQVGERENMGATQQQQAAFDKLADGRHHNEMLIFIDDPRFETLAHKGGKNAQAIVLEFSAKGTGEAGAGGLLCG